MMNFRKTLLTGMAVGMASLSAIALAGNPDRDDDCGPKGGKFMHHRMMGDMHGPEMRLEHITKRLDLSAEQESQVDKILDEAKVESEPLRERMKAGMEAEREAVEARKPEDELKALARNTADTRVEMMVHGFAVEEKIRAVLTDEQKAELDEMKAKRKAHFQERMEKFHERKGEGSEN